jgi:hypothetical protein
LHEVARAAGCSQLVWPLAGPPPVVGTSEFVTDVDRPAFREALLLLHDSQVPDPARRAIVAAIRAGG